MKKRVDKLLVELGLVRSRTRAHELIKAGLVKSQGQVILKPSQEVEESGLSVEENDNFVGRGAHKIESVYEKFNLNFENKIILDVGSSTGGFTDFAIRKNAEKIFAVDVGVNQLDAQLRVHPAVVVMEATDIRNTVPTEQKVDLAMIDVSFISLVHIWPAVVNWLRPEGEILSLIKPQFEAGPAAIGKGGVVKDLEQHVRVLQELQGFARTLGLKLTAASRCGIKGRAGNQEYFFYFNPLAGEREIDIRAIVFGGSDQ
jgi:23S rRNA (cytidine1920-2'-O)/16S rRNA (cytidine1409-2'-O)-methyltransferase